MCGEIKRMTREEKCIVTAYTGFLMVNVDTFRSWLKENNYTEPIEVEKLRAEVRDRFLELCDKE